jgi:hypothetical protein
MLVDEVGKLMIWPGKITEVRTKLLTCKSPARFTFVFRAIPPSESFLTTVYVGDEGVSELIPFDGDLAKAPGTPTRPKTVAEHKDAKSACLKYLMLRFTG